MDKVKCTVPHCDKPALVALFLLPQEVLESYAGCSPMPMGHRCAQHLPREEWRPGVVASLPHCLSVRRLPLTPEKVIGGRL